MDVVSINAVAPDVSAETCCALEQSESSGFRNPGVPVAAFLELAKAGEGEVHGIDALARCRALRNDFLTTRLRSRCVTVEAHRPVGLLHRHDVMMCGIADIQQGLRARCNEIARMARRMTLDLDGLDD